MYETLTKCYSGENEFGYDDFDTVQRHQDVIDKLQVQAANRFEYAHSPFKSKTKALKLTHTQVD